MTAVNGKEKDKEESLPQAERRQTQRAGKDRRHQRPDLLGHIPQRTSRNGRGGAARQAVMDNTIGPRCVPGRLGRLSNHLRTQGENLHAAVRGEARLIFMKHLHVSCQEMTGHSPTFRG